jgi:hypothetical protein
MPAQSESQGDPREPTTEPLHDWRRTICVALTLALASLSLAGLLMRLPSSGTPGWDEAGHGFAALELAARAQAVDFPGWLSALARTDYYPPLGRLGLSLGFFLFGSGFEAPRTISAVVWWLLLLACAAFAQRIGAEGSSKPQPWRGLAAPWAVAFGASSWLCLIHANTCFLEVWSGLAGALGGLGLLAAFRGKRLGALVSGACASTGLLIKWTYGLQFLGAFLAFSAWELFLRRRSTARASWPLRRLLGRLSLACIPLALPLLWWFALPLPLGLEVAAAHRQAFIEYLTKAGSLEGLPRSQLWIAWGLQMCLSLPIFVVQVAALIAGLFGRQGPAVRLAICLIAVGFGGFLVYPYRIERFLVPFGFPLWALSGAAIVRTFAALRLATRTHLPVPALHLMAVLALFASRGLGAVDFLKICRSSGSDQDPGRLQRVVSIWQGAFESQPAPASGPPGTRQVLEFAAKHLRSDRPFRWIGGTCSELPPNLVRWYLFSQDRLPAAFDWNYAGAAHFWSDPGFGIDGLRHWAKDCWIVITLDPPDPRRRRGREFEERLVAEFRTLPEFRIRATETIQISPGLPHLIQCHERIRN